MNVGDTFKFKAWDKLTDKTRASWGYSNLNYNRYTDKYHITKISTNGIHFGKIGHRAQGCIDVDIVDICGVIIL